MDPALFCVVCKPGYHGSDCNKCPADYVYRDIPAAVAAVYLVLAGLYVVHLPDNRNETTTIKKVRNRRSSTAKRGKLLQQLFYVLLTQSHVLQQLLLQFDYWRMQIPKIPVLAVLYRIMQLLSLDLKGFFLSIECGADGDARSAWISQVLVTCFATFLYLALYICAKLASTRSTCLQKTCRAVRLRRSSAAWCCSPNDAAVRVRSMPPDERSTWIAEKATITHSAVTYFFVLASTFHLRLALDMLNCGIDEVDGNQLYLILDAGTCPIAGGPVYLAIIALAVLMGYVIGPYVGLLMALCRARAAGNLMERVASDPMFQARYGWATSKYKPSAFFWEFCSVSHRLLIVTTGVLLNAKAAVYAQVGITSVALALQLVVRPFKFTPINELGAPAGGIGCLSRCFSWFCGTLYSANTLQAAFMLAELILLVTERPGSEASDAMRTSTAVLIVFVFFVATTQALVYGTRVARHVYRRLSRRSESKKHDQGTESQQPHKMHLQRLDGGACTTPSSSGDVRYPIRGLLLFPLGLLLTLFAAALLLGTAVLWAMISGPMLSMSVLVATVVFLDVGEAFRCCCSERVQANFMVFFFVSFVFLCGPFQILVVTIPLAIFMAMSRASHIVNQVLLDTCMATWWRLLEQPLVKCVSTLAPLFLLMTHSDPVGLLESLSFGKTKMLQRMEGREKYAYTCCGSRCGSSIMERLIAHAFVGCLLAAPVTHELIRAQGNISTRTAVVLCCGISGCVGTLFSVVLFALPSSAAGRQDDATKISPVERPALVEDKRGPGAELAPSSAGTEPADSRSSNSVPEPSESAYSQPSTRHADDGTDLIRQRQSGRHSITFRAQGADISSHETQKLESDPSARDAGASRELFQACADGDCDACKEIVGRGADVNWGDENGVTALHIASTEGYLEICELLLNHGSNLTQATTRGRTAIHVACKEGYMEVCQLLLDRGANANHTDQNGVAPLSLASEEGYAEICELLLNCGANVNQADRNGAAALHIASREGCLDVCELLLDHGAIIDQVDRAGATALYMATDEGCYDVCHLLLDRGADVNLAAANGRSPLSVASDPVVRQLLLAHSASEDGQGSQATSIYNFT